MKTIGLIGGMSWESTASYYKIINEAIKNKLGGLHSSKILMYSVDFQEIEECQVKGDWNKSGDILSDAAKRLEVAGADFIVICTNTMHKVVPQIETQINIPILHIAEATSEVLTDNRIKKVALLGTKYTMEQDFYKDKILSSGIEVIIPNKTDIEIINDIIYDELCLGIIKEQSKSEFIRIINTLTYLGAQGVILGCTEIGLLINKNDVDIPVFDTTLIHALKAVEYSLK